MTRLVCSATNCLYNDDRYCCKGDIQIDGEGATTSNATCCKSFRERKGEAGRMRQWSQIVTLRLTVKPAAVNTMRTAVVLPTKSVSGGAMHVTVRRQSV